MIIKEEYLEELAFLEMEEIKFEIMNILSNYGKSYTLDCRVKTLEKIHQKQLLYQERNKPCTLDDIPDIIGFRIAVETQEEVIRIYTLINSIFEPKRVVDFFNYPKSTGYKAFNCFYGNWAFGTEIQIMTKEMRDWTNATHEEHNKLKYGDIMTRSRTL